MLCSPLTARMGGRIFEMLIRSTVDSQREWRDFDGNISIVWVNDVEG